MKTFFFSQSENKKQEIKNEREYYLKKN